MINPSESAGSTPADEARPNWDWLQQRIPETTAEEFEAWLAAELVELEEKFSGLITVGSRGRALRSELARERRA